MIPTKKVEQLVDKHQSLEKELSSGDVDKKDFAIKSKEYSSLGEIIQCAREYLNFEKQKKELDKMINEQNTDKEMKELAQKELKQLIETKQRNEKTLKLYLLPKDETDKKNAILEIRAGTGGLEASLFAADFDSIGVDVSGHNDQGTNFGISDSGSLSLGLAGEGYTFTFDQDGKVLLRGSDKVTVLIVDRAGKVNHLQRMKVSIAK